MMSIQSYIGVLFVGITLFFFVLSFYFYRMISKDPVKTPGRIYEYAMISFVNLFVFGMIGEITFMCIGFTQMIPYAIMTMYIMFLGINLKDFFI